MGYKTKSTINQASGLDVKNKLKKELNKNKTNKAYEKQAESIGTYINKGGEKGYKKSQRKEARAVGKEAAKNVDTSFKKSELAGTDFNSLLIGTIKNLEASSGASSKKRKVKKAARKEHKEFQKKGSSNFDGEGLTESFKGTDLPKIDSGIKTGDFFQDTFANFNPERDKGIKKQAKDIKKQAKDKKYKSGISKDLGDKIKLYSPTKNNIKSKTKIRDQYEVNPTSSYVDRTFDYLKEVTGLDKFPTPRELLGLQMTGDGFNKGILRKNKYKK